MKSKARKAKVDKEDEVLALRHFGIHLTFELLGSLKISRSIFEFRIFEWNKVCG
jgi:hypothetical protein